MKTLQTPEALQQNLHRLDLIADSVCLNCNIDPKDIIRPCKKRELVDGRRIICYLSVKLLGVEQHHIANRLNYANRSAVSLKNKSCSDLMHSDKAFRELVDRIEKELNLN